MGFRSFRYHHGRYCSDGKYNSSLRMISDIKKKTGSFISAIPNLNATILNNPNVNGCCHGRC